jgi:hypothetical protein
MGDEHARLRKEFNVFFNTKNVDAIISKLNAEVLSVCSDVSETAAKAPGGVASVEVTGHAASVINTVVRKVWPPTCCHMPKRRITNCWQSSWTADLRVVADRRGSSVVYCQCLPLFFKDLKKKTLGRETDVSQAMWESSRQHAGLF